MKFIICKLSLSKCSLLLIIITFCLWSLCWSNKMKVKASNNKNSALVVNNSYSYPTNSTSTKNKESYQFYSIDYYEAFSPRLFEAITDNQCNINRCSPPHGQCFEHTCKCIKGYTNTYNVEKDKFCGYKIKSQLIAFMLETFTFIGGDIYLGNNYYAFFKGLYIFIMILLFLFKIPCKHCGMRDLMDYTCAPCLCIKTGTLVICIFGIITWEIADLIRIMSYQATDSNHMPLEYFF